MSVWFKSGLWRGHSINLYGRSACAPILLKGLILIEFKLLDRWPHIILSCYHSWINDCKLPSPGGGEASQKISPLTHFTICVRCLFKKRLLILWPDNLRFIYSDQNLPADLVLANCSFDLFWTAWTFSWHDSSEGQMCAILCWSAPLIVAVSKREQIFACLNLSRKSTVDCARQLGTKVTQANSRTLLNWTQLWEPVIPPC